MIRDADVRTRAIDPEISCIIQAPAGSGKTELLTRRFLALLSRVQEPEEILALTFTRKAAQEMRSRVLAALELQGTALDNPARLRIMTIDAFCASIVRGMPVTSQFGALPAIAQQSEKLYRTAVENFLKSQKLPVQLRLHLDNQEERLARLLIDTLARRDQWIRLLYETKQHDEPREILESHLKTILNENLLRADAHLTFDMKSAIFQVLKKTQRSWEELDDFPPADCDHFPHWLALCEFLLTKQFTWRKTVTKDQGILAPSSAKNPDEKRALTALKEEALGLLNSLAGYDELREHLENLALSPPIQYSDSQWEIAQCLLEHLPALLAELTLVFRQQQQVDFTSISHHSVQALGSLDDTSDLALRLDYQIQHILVDEFQDTSFVQFHLLEKLTAGWQPGDQRSLFLVGDPMQSIYRFRQAEVGLFIRAKQFGIGSIPLESLQLTSNFRSCRNMIQWVNNSFASIFPHEDDLRQGGVSYSPADPIHPEAPHGGCYYFLAQDKSDEMKKIVEIVQEQLQNSSGTIAILVKARGHLRDCLSRLAQTGISAQAIELDSLAQRPVVMDLWSLTRALLHLGDRVAWFSILRAPWAGLTLTDLLAISDHHPDQTLYENCLDFAAISSLSEDGKIRLAHLTCVLQAAMSMRKRGSLRSWVEITWEQLGGLAVLPDAQAFQDAMQYFEFLESAENPENIAETEADLARLLASSYEPSRVQVMTIHKSKGLEFDTVILPSLEQTSQSGQEELMLWQEHTTLEGDQQLLLAPIKAVDAEADAIYRFLRREEKKKEAQENKRLLYVAITRAKTACFLTATLENPEERAPRAGSFLAELWPEYRVQFLENMVSFTESATPEPKEFSMIHRLPHAWYRLQPMIDKWEPQPNPFHFSLEIEARVTGTFLHRLLEWLHELDPMAWSLGDFHPERWATQLLQLGLPETSLESTLDYIHACMAHLISDPKARWIFSHSHSERAAELALQSWEHEAPERMVLDRTFIDEQQIRWIIDFKTRPDPDLQEEKRRYHRQLQRYATALEQLGHEPIRCALYYLHSGAWLEWEFEHAIA